MLAAGHVDADHRDVGRLAQGLVDGGGQRDRVARVGQRHDVGEPGRRSALGLGLTTGTMPTVRRRLRARAAASESEPLLPAPPMTATVGACPAST